jgi:L-rhamnose mutarotase
MLRAPLISLCVRSISPGEALSCWRRHTPRRGEEETMQSFGLTLCLQDDGEKIETYKEYHRAVWQEVLAGHREAGIERMQIFLVGRRMFMYVDTSDDFVPARDFARAAASPRAKEWNEFMATLQERAPEAAPGEWWALMERVFDSDWPQHAHGDGA